MDYIHALILGIIEGLTEFLPVSSTGHMVIASSLMGINKLEIVKFFEVVSQLGAILAIVSYFRKKFFPKKGFIEFYLKLVLGVVPAGVLGLLFSDKINEAMENPMTIAIVIIVGGLVLIFIEKLFTKVETIEIEKVTYKQSFIIGCWQCLAVVFPGMSRSASTIMEGLSQKLNRETAVEFSFFLAVPTMVAASGYKVLKAFLDPVQKEVIMNTNNLGVILFGCVITFIVSMLVVGTFINIVKKYGLKPFGIYRVIIGVIFLVLVLTGIIQ